MAYYTPFFNTGAGSLTSEEEAFVQNLAGLSYVQGDILYFDGSAMNRLPAGNDGEFLKTQGVGANPVWGAVGGGMNIETPTGTVDGVNTIFTTANTPKFLIIDSLIYVSGQGYTYSNPTINVDALVTPQTFIRSIY